MKRSSPAWLVGVLFALLVVPAATGAAQEDTTGAAQEDTTGSQAAEQPTSDASPTTPRELVTSSVSLLPADPDPDDPHNGTWFVLTIEPGASGRAVAAVTNPTDSPLDVRLFLADLEFRDDGTPVLAETESSGVGAWGRFDRDTVRIPPQATRRVPFQITVPSGTLSRDHIGAAVAETTATAPDGTQVVQRVATRVIVTVPGAGDRAFEIASVDVERDSSLWPSELVVRVRLRNTGEIRVAPTVTVAGVAADGPRALVSRSSETWVATVDVAAIGGHVRLPVVATETGGITRRVDRAQIVVPWGWALILGLLAVAAAGGARLLRRRDRVASLQADVRRLESLVTRMRGAAENASRPTMNGELRVTTEEALHSALRSARRAGENASFGRVALALHEFNHDALTPLLEAAARESSLRPQLIEAIASYGSDAVISHPLGEELPADVYAAVLERAARAPTPPPA